MELRKSIAEKHNLYNKLATFINIFFNRLHHLREPFPADVSMQEPHQPGADITGSNARHRFSAEHDQPTNGCGTRDAGLLVIEQEPLPPFGGVLLPKADRLSGGSHPEPASTSLSAS